MFLSEHFHFSVVKFLMYLNRRVFVITLSQRICQIICMSRQNLNINLNMLLQNATFSSPGVAQIFVFDILNSSTPSKQEMGS